MSEAQASTPTIVAGRYRLQEQLGVGGMAVVNAALDEQSGARVAIKRLLPEAAEKAAAVSLFEREFHTLKSLSHPNVVSVLDYGLGSTPFYTMEVLSGSSASSLSPMSWERAVRVLRDVASALSLLHSRRLVHRDVTSHNIFLCDDGGVKLIDFGALSPMGVARDIVGTPPFTPPEVLGQLTLDQRTDLYSLGAAAYHLLTGAHAYPARRMDLLREVWRSRLKPPSAVAEVPQELDELVMSLLDLNPAARPDNAGIVVARLTAMAGLAPEPTGTTARSFLVTPRLVGRQSLVEDFRARISRLRKRRGGMVLLRGVEGVGRSRMLDAIALEAQLLGATIVRADSRDAQDGEDLAAALGRALSRVLPEAADASGDSEKLPPIKLLRRAMKTRSLVVLLDDLDRFEPSALALLLRLSRMADRHPLLVVATHVTPLPDDLIGPINLLSAHAETVEVEPLSAEQTEELVSSYFHGAAHLGEVARFCLTVSAGRTATIAALAQHLMDEGVARFDGSTWHLPSHLNEHDLPASAADFLARRLTHLDADARTWGLLLSIMAAATRLTLKQCVELISDRMPPERSYRAVASLIAEQFATDDGELPRINQAQIRAAILDAASPEETRALHFAVARHLESVGNDSALFAAAHHLLHADRLDDCLRVMRRASEMAFEAPASDEELAEVLHPFGRWGEAFVTATSHAEQQGRPLRELYPLYHLMTVVGVLNDPGTFEHGKPLFGHLCRDIGLDFYSEAELDALDGGQAPKKHVTLYRLGRAAIRTLRTPPAQRGLSPLKALELFGLYLSAALGVANLTYTIDQVVPPLRRALAPFRSLSPGLDVVYEMLVCSYDAARGISTGWARLRTVIDTLRKPVGGMPEKYQMMAFHITRYMEALECGAPLADPKCLEIAEALEGADGFETHAWQLRMLFHAYDGDAVEAERCRRELEGRSLNSARDDLSILAGVRNVAQVQALSGDLSGLQRTLQTLETAAQRFPAWRGHLLVYRGEYARLMGNLEAARVSLEEAIAFASPGERHSWPIAIPPYLDVLMRMGCLAQAVAVADSACDDCERLDIASVHRRLVESTAARVWAVAGQHERARAMFERLRSEAEAAFIRGITLASLEEDRARAALAMADADAFNDAAARVALVFANHDMPSVNARYQRLLYDASRLGISTRESLRAPDNDEDSVERLSAHIAHEAAGVRYRRALSLLMERCQARGGHLFTLAGGRAECLASVGDATTEMTGLDDFVHALGDDGEEDESEVTVTVSATALSAGKQWTSDSGVTYDPFLMTTPDGVLVCVAMLEPQGDHLNPPPYAFTRNLLAAFAATGGLPEPMRSGPPGPVLAEEAAVAAFLEPQVAAAPGAPKSATR